MKNNMGFLALATLFANRLDETIYAKGNRRSGEFITIEDRENFHKKKCLNPKCDNFRSYKKLYCSAECCKDHKGFSYKERLNKIKHETNL